MILNNHTSHITEQRKKTISWTQVGRNIIDISISIAKLGEDDAIDIVGPNDHVDEGIMIVLTASDIEMSDFNLNPFMAFAGGFPQYLVIKKLYPPLPDNTDGTAKFAPYGLRKVESLLIDEFGKENVVVAHPSKIHRFIGPRTKIIGITTMDPLGTGFVSRTYTSLLGLDGKTATHSEFESLMKNPAIRQSAAKVIVGGSGAWQISDARIRQDLGIDTIMMGQAERSLKPLIKKALAGEALEPLVESQAPAPQEIPPIKGAAIYGVVEIMRGCGRGCSFCSPTLRQRHSFPIEHILKEVELNAMGGSRMIILQTDDLLLYQAKANFIPNREAIVNLIHEVSKVEGVEFLQAAHASLAPVVYDKGIIEEIAPSMVDRSVWTCRGARCASVEVGIETGSPRLMRQYMRGKMLPYSPEQWPDVVVRSIEILNDNDVFPLATLILGLPGEQAEDVQATLSLLDRLVGSKLFYVPLLFTSEEESKLKQQKHGNLKDLDSAHWEILSSCWKHNIDVWSPEMSSKIMLSSLLFSPFYLMKHGWKVIEPVMRISGLDDILVGKKAGVKCRPDLCVPDLCPITEGETEQ